MHGLDGPEHRYRKAMFLDVLTPERVVGLADEVETAVGSRVATWPGREVRIYDELVRAYGCGVMSWAGVPMTGTDAELRSRCMAEIVDGFGFSGLAYPRAWRARVYSDRWARRLVKDVREGRI